MTDDIQLEQGRFGCKAKVTMICINMNLTGSEGRATQRQTKLGMIRYVIVCDIDIVQRHLDRVLKDKYIEIDDIRVLIV